MAQRARRKCASSVEPATPSATAELVGTTAARRLRRTRHHRTSGARAACCFCGSSREASHSKSMLLEAHGIVQHTVDGLRATGSINSQRLMPMWWSADLTSAPTCTAEEPIRTSRHLQQTACTSWSVGRAECCTACATLGSMQEVASQPLSAGA